MNFRPLGNVPEPPQWPSVLGWIIALAFLFIGLFTINSGGLNTIVSGIVIGVVLAIIQILINILFGMMLEIRGIKNVLEENPPIASPRQKED